MNSIAILFLGFSAVMAWLIVRSLRAGRANRGSVTFIRAKLPFMFWLTLMLYGVMMRCLVGPVGHA
jgi:hypothetical protein